MNVLLLLVQTAVVRHSNATLFGDVRIESGGGFNLACYPLGLCRSLLVEGVRAINLGCVDVFVVVAR